MEWKNDQIQGKKIQCKSSSRDTRQETQITGMSFKEKMQCIGKCNAWENTTLLEETNAMFDKSLYYGLYMCVLCACMCDIVQENRALRWVTKVWSALEKCVKCIRKCMVHQKNCGVMD